MHDGSVIAIVAIVFGTVLVIVRTIVGAISGGRSSAPRSDSDIHSQRELFDLAMRLQSRVETLERLLDGKEPEWRGKP